MDDDTDHKFQIKRVQWTGYTWKKKKKSSLKEQDLRKVGQELLKGMMLSEINQTERDKYYMIITYMWNLKNTTN